MFQSARIKLTAWYLIILMTISIIFSFVIFQGARAELERGLRAQEFRSEILRFQEGQTTFPPRIENILIDPDVLNESTTRLIVFFIFINLGIFIIAGAAGYFLAGQTLRPILEMVNEQNRFIADASHEIRTPLTSLRSEIEVYLREKMHNTNETNDLLKSNLEEINALQTLSDNLLELTRYQQETVSKDLFKTCSVQEIVETSKKKLTISAKEKKIEILTKIGKEKIKGDYQQLVQLFIIFMDNAIKYSSKNKRVFINSRRTDGMIKITVKDEGIGISEKDLTHVFDRFFRADTSRSKSNVSGYGLGLSIAQKIVHEHKGNLQVKSKLGRGTEIIILLPAA